MNIIDNTLHEIRMAFVLFANAFSGAPPIRKPARLRWSFRTMTRWRRMSGTRGCSVRVSYPKGSANKRPSRK
jgi:hypothetical protein